MSTEPTKLNRLRPVNRNPVVTAQDAEKTGIIFECPTETNCPHCRALVPLTDVRPLSTLACPGCGGKVLAPGRVGGFLLYEHIGEGEMGAIYRATDESLNRDVAIKLVRKCLVDNPESCERLRQEARAAGKLNHSRVAQVYALNFSNGHPYLVMELVSGEDFGQKLNREGRIDERTALRMALDVAQGLSALNREGLVHGDIKPSNIVLDRDGNAKLVDFGLSGMTRHDENGGLVGTPNYIAPELLRGAADTHRSDLYSLGATLYHLLSGRCTHEGQTPADVIRARLTQLPDPLVMHARHVSAPTQKLVMRMLEREPEDRPADSDAVVTEIREALALLNQPKPASARSQGLAHRFFVRSRAPQQAHPLASQRRRPTAFTFTLGVILMLELVIAIKTQSFEQPLRWLSRELAVQLNTTALDDAPPQPHTAPPAYDHLTAEVTPVWQSMDMGERTQRGSTIQMGGSMIVQGTGTDLWKGYDRCRFVWTRLAGDYAFSARILALADTHRYAVTGLLVKGDDPAQGPRVLYGFLGNGELFLQIRHPNNKTTVAKRSEEPIRLPIHLKLVRRGHAFDAYVSTTGHSWRFFATGGLELPPGNTIGFAVSAQVPDVLATAKFDSIRLLTSDPTTRVP